MDLEESQSTETVGPQSNSPQSTCGSRISNNISEIRLEDKDTRALVNISPREPPQADLIARSDNYLLARINKFLCGVPPPPRLTVCRSDCSDFLSLIHKNHNFFWNTCSISGSKVLAQQGPNECLDRTKEECAIGSYHLQRIRHAPRNLTSSFEACNAFNARKDTDSVTDPANECSTAGVQGKVSLHEAERTFSSGKMAAAASSTLASKCARTMMPGNDSATEFQSACGSTQVECDLSTPSFRPSVLLYHTLRERDAVQLEWPEAYHHKFHGIHYNRNKAVEQYENLTMRLCDRYIGAETQSTCNVWFSKHTPGSARKRSLLGKRETGQSPGKRLSHLAKRRRTFSSANLQGLGLADKKQLVLNVSSRKLAGRKTKSPRGKSPRGKSPRKCGSAKKRAVRRLALDGPSPRKARLETSKRALFQSPPSDRAGPSRAPSGPASNPQKIKRALFPTPKKRREESADDATATLAEETKKRKREDDERGIEEPRSKWAKSLSFDCAHEFNQGGDPNKSWERARNSSGHVFLRTDTTSVVPARNELSDTHRKKLLWAVAEALRSKGIGMGHPCFKQYASSLARTVRKFMPDLENRNAPRKPGSTSDRMLKLARHHVLFVIDEKPTD